MSARTREAQNPNHTNPRPPQPCSLGRVIWRMAPGKHRDFGMFRVGWLVGGGGSLEGSATTKSKPTPKPPSPGHKHQMFTPHAFTQPASSSKATVTGTGIRASASQKTLLGASGLREPRPCAQPSEPILFRKLRIYFTGADFPYLLCSIGSHIKTSLVIAEGSTACR